jgi:hypothetical protein
VIARATPLADILEDEWDRQLFRGPNALATTLGWTSYHTLRSKGSKSGYPDRTLVRDRIVFVELKREKTKPTPAQIAWLDKLARAGGEVYLWRPSDLDEIGLILSTRAVPTAAGGLVQTGRDTWHPRSRWVAGVGRMDTS